MVGIEVDRALGLDAVHVLGEVAAICLRIILEIVLTLPQHRMSVVTEHVLGASALVAKSTEMKGLAGGQAIRLSRTHTALSGGIELIGPFAPQLNGLPGWKIKTIQYGLVQIFWSLTSTQIVLVAIAHKRQKHIVDHILAQTEVSQDQRIIIVVLFIGCSWGIDFNIFIGCSSFNIFSGCGAI